VRVIADDLSGAADAGVAFAAHGHAVRVSLDGWSAGVVVVVDADTREADGAIAAARVARLAAEPAHGELLKKIDSTLRGRIGEELAAVREALPHRLLVVAPAFPRAGRTTRGGVQHVHGVPLHRSDAWAAELGEPPRSVAEALDGLPVREVAAERAQLEAAAAAGCVAVCDADGDADLDALVAAAAGIDVVWAGSAGLAAALARARPGERAAQAWPGDDERYFAVVGSATELAAQQAAELCAAGAELVELPRDALVVGDLEDLTREVLDHAARGNVVVTIAGPPDRASAAAVRASLAAIVAPAAREASVLVLTGGATARAVLEQLDVRVLDLLAEPEPGVAVATANGRHIVTKAGAFGDGGTLARVLHGRTTA
jgi:4-hydroxythreonine-4-phosphate dehydrogenase